MLTLVRTIENRNERLDNIKHQLINVLRKYLSTTYSEL